MNVTSISQVLGWVNNHRVTEVRNTYHYDKGNSVTTVVTHSQEYQLIGYNKNGKPVNNNTNSIDIKV